MQLKQQSKEIQLINTIQITKNSNQNFNNMKSNYQIINPEHNQFCQKAVNFNCQNKIPRNKFEGNPKNNFKQINHPSSQKLFEITTQRNGDFDESKLSNQFNRKPIEIEEDERFNTSAISTRCNSRKSSDGSFKQKFKTEICKFWDLNKVCKFGDNCAFAHGRTEMKHKIISSNSYKTKNCKQFFEIGFCPYGSRCQFLHQVNDKLNFSYNDSLKQFGCESKNERKRLDVFESICNVNTRRNSGLSSNEESLDF